MQEANEREEEKDEGVKQRGHIEYIFYRTELHGTLRWLLKEVVQEKDRLAQKSYLGRVFRWYNKKLEPITPKPDRIITAETVAQLFPPIEDGGKRKSGSFKSKG